MHDFAARPAGNEHWPRFGCIKLHYQPIGGVNSTERAQDKEMQKLTSQL